MSTYKTGNPLGSAAVKDLFDNAENLDFALNSLTALIWTDRLGKTRRSFFGMESAFVTQLTSQESRFNTFIQSSGYQIVGDYTAGPLTLTEYNQLIRYNNELYKLTAATDIPFTTAGNTDETWTSTDAAHFVSVGDAALRQNLGSDEPGMGDNIITHVPTELDDQITTVNQALSAQAPTIWQYARHVIDRPTVFPSTWDWGPAFQAAHDNDNVGPLLINGETYTVRTPVVYEYTDDDYTKYSRLPRCLSGSASIDYSELGNGGRVLMTPLKLTIQLNLHMSRRLP